MFKKADTVKRWTSRLESFFHYVRVILQFTIINTVPKIQSAIAVVVQCAFLSIRLINECISDKSGWLMTLGSLCSAEKKCN